MNLACHFVTTAALALVEDQRYVWGQNRDWSKTRVPDARMEHFSEMSRTIVEIEQLLDIEHMERKNFADDEFIRRQIIVQIKHYKDRAAIATKSELKIEELKAEIKKQKQEQKLQIYLDGIKKYIVSCDNLLTSIKNGTKSFETSEDKKIFLQDEIVGMKAEIELLEREISDNQKRFDILDPNLINSLIHEQMGKIKNLINTAQNLIESISAAHAPEAEINSKFDKILAWLRKDDHISKQWWTMP